MSAKPNKRSQCKSVEDLYKLCTQVFHPGLKGGILIKDMDPDPTGPGIQKLVKKFKSKKFTALRDIAKDLGATEADLKEIYRNKDKSAAMIIYIAKLQVTINDTYLLLRQAEMFDLETIAIDTRTGREQSLYVSAMKGDPMGFVLRVALARLVSGRLSDYTLYY